MTTVLPAGLTQAQFEQAVAGFRAAVGPEWVFVSEEDRRSYTDPFAVGDPLEHEPSLAVAPASVQQVQAVLRVANSHRVPLWPVSMGKNFAYGAAAPVGKGCAVLDLKRMNRVLEIDEQLGYALVEPGVSFLDFHRALQGRKVWMSGPSQSWGSIMGNALEHGVGYTPYGVHADMICGMEVVLPDGEIVRTGMGAVEGTKEWQAYRLGYGPVWDGAFTQSNFGIVTKMGVWLQPEPEGMAGVRVSVPREDQLEALIDTLRPLRLNDTINATYTIANGMRQAMRGGQRKALYTGQGQTPHDVIDARLKAQGDGWWSVIFNLFDRPEVLDVRLRVIREAFAKLPGAVVTADQRWVQGQPQAPWMRQDVSLGPLGIVNWYGGRGGHTDFGPVVVPVGARVRQVYDTVYAGFRRHGLDCSVGMFGLGQRAIVMVADFIYDRDDARMVKAVRACFGELTQEMSAIGVGLYRAHIQFMEEGARMQTFNDHALGRFNARIKAALDPNGVIAPGKQGIGLSRTPWSER